MDTVEKLKHLPPAVRQLISASQRVVEAEADDEHKSVISQSIAELKKALGNFALGDTRQPHRKDLRQKGPI